MTSPRDPDALIRAYLDEGVTELPDRAFDLVRGDLGRNRQRVVIGPWKGPDMSILKKGAIAAAVLVGVGLAWANLGGSSPGVASRPTPSPTATADPSPVASSRSALIPYDGLLDPGLHGFRDVVPITVRVPAGWSAYRGFAITKNDGTPTELAMAPWAINDVYVDPCTNHRNVKPPPGPSVAALAQALSDQPGLTADPVTDVTVDGYAGKLVRFTVTTDITTCPEGFWPWGTGVDYRHVQGTNEVDRIYILDIDGVRLSIVAAYQQASSAADRAELDAIIASLDINP